jgi:hypothetical protein
LTRRKIESIDVRDDGVFFYFEGEKGAFSAKHFPFGSTIWEDALRIAAAIEWFNGIVDAELAAKGET